MDSNRLVARNDAPVRPERAYVLYWMIAARRSASNFALDRAIEHARDLGKPLVVLEGLKSDAPYSSARFHRFVLDGMRDQRDAFAQSPVTYYPYVEPRSGEDRGLLACLAENACLVVADDFPGRMQRALVRSAAAQLDVLVEAVDSCGVLPIRTFDRRYVRAFDYRRHAKPLWSAGTEAPEADPLKGLDLPRLDALPGKVVSHWPAATDALLDNSAGLEQLPIDQSIPPVALRGGQTAARERLASFLEDVLPLYGDKRGHPSIASGLSPHLHFGHIGAHEVQRAAASAPEELAEPFLDQLLTWRELCYHFAHHTPDHDRYESLPDWAKKTLAEHADDPREFVYTPRQFEEAQTHDELWNAAQRQLRRDGMIDNYLRMLWGKKILHWSPSPERAFQTMVELNDRYAVDGRDPNSYGGIGWVLGRFDRPWGPEREIFGRIRYMTSDSARRKFKLNDYIERYAETAAPGLFA